MTTYKEQQNQKYTDRTLQMLCDLPDFCSVFYDKKQQKLSPKTLCDYTRHMKDYLEYLQQYDPRFSDRELINFTVEDLSQISVSDATDFIKWITRSIMDDRTSATGIKMSLSSTKTWKACISAYFMFFTFSWQLNGNPFACVDLTKIVTCDDVREKEKEGKIANKKVMTVAAVDADGTGGLINRSFIHSNKESDDKGNDWAAEEQPELSERESIQFRQQFMLKHGIRDTLICSILQDTGIRISELVELNEKDVDFSNKRFYVYRAKNKSSWMSITDDVCGLLQVYTEQRINWIRSILCDSGCYSHDSLLDGNCGSDGLGNPVDNMGGNSGVVAGGLDNKTVYGVDNILKNDMYNKFLSEESYEIRDNSSSLNEAWAKDTADEDSKIVDDASNTIMDDGNNKGGNGLEDVGIENPSEPSEKGRNGGSEENDTVRAADSVGLLESQLSTKRIPDTVVSRQGDRDLQGNLQENKYHQRNKYPENIGNADLDALFIVMAGRCRGQRLSVRTVQRAMKEWKCEMREYLEQKRM